MIDNMPEGTNKIPCYNFSFRFHYYGTKGIQIKSYEYLWNMSVHRWKCAMSLTVSDDIVVMHLKNDKPWKTF